MHCFSCINKKRLCKSTCCKKCCECCEKEVESEEKLCSCCYIRLYDIYKWLKLKCWFCH